jgi:hypothetical protein
LQNKERGCAAQAGVRATAAHGEQQPLPGARGEPYRCVAEQQRPRVWATASIAQSSRRAAIVSVDRAQ